VGLPRLYPMTIYPYARDHQEEDYYRRVHYFAGALLAFGAGEDVLHALDEVWQQVVRRSGDVLPPARWPLSSGPQDHPGRL
jgi:hypothetical protein